MKEEHTEDEEVFDPPHGKLVCDISVTDEHIYFTYDDGGKEISVRGSIRQYGIFEDNERGLHTRGIFEADLQSGSHIYRVMIVFADTCGQIFERPKLLDVDFYATKVCASFLTIADRHNQKAVLIREPGAEWDPVNARMLGRMGPTLVAYCG